MQTLATLSPAPAIRRLALVGLYLAVLLVCAVLAVGDVVRGEGHMIWLGVAALLAVLVARGVLDQVLLLGVLFSHARAVLQVRDGRLVYLSPLLGGVALADIEQVSVVERRRGFGKRPHVLVTAGRRSLLAPVDVCLEPGEEIVSRLRALS